MSSLAATLELFRVFGDPTRVRLVALLARQELTVAELTAVTGLAQPRVSTHLGKLKEAGILRDRRDGASTVYSLNDGTMPADARNVWSLLETQADDGILRADRARCEALLRARGNGWPDALAGQMERHYSPGRTWEATARAFVGLMQLGDVLDAGAGDGTIAELVAPRARSLTCLDRSDKMLAAARQRLAALPNVRFARGDLHAIPSDDEAFDHVLLFNVLTLCAKPGRVLEEARRVLRPGGGLTLVTLDAHAYQSVTAPYGHVHAGFRPAALRRLLAHSGLDVAVCEVTSREKREPHFEVVTAFARRPRGG